MADALHHGAVAGYIEIGAQILTRLAHPDPLPAVVHVEHGSATVPVGALAGGGSSGPRKREILAHPVKGYKGRVAHAKEVS